MATCELLRQRKLSSQSAEPPLCSKGEGVFLDNVDAEQKWGRMSC
jgi:hypothetical protein